ncbi:MAG TPA: hypothetical protein VIV11_34050 [Kofleriaceae bacterium]
MKLLPALVMCLIAVSSTAAADPVADSKKDLDNVKAAIAKKTPGQGLAPCRRAMERQAAVEQADKALAGEIATMCTRDIYVAQLQVSLVAREAERSQKKTGPLPGCFDGSARDARMKLKALPKLDASIKTLIDKYNKLCPV